VFYIKHTFYKKDSAFSGSGCHLNCLSLCICVQPGFHFARLAVFVNRKTANVSAVDTIQERVCTQEAYYLPSWWSFSHKPKYGGGRMPRRVLGAAGSGDRLHGDCAWSFWKREFIPGTIIASDQWRDVSHHKRAWIGHGAVSHLLNPPMELMLKALSLAGQSGNFGSKAGVMAWWVLVYVAEACGKRCFNDLIICLGFECHLCNN